PGGVLFTTPRCVDAASVEARLMFAFGESEHWTYIRSSLRLIDIPEYRCSRAVEDPRERFSPRADPAPLPERDVDDLVIDVGLDIGGDFVLLSPQETRS